MGDQLAAGETGRTGERQLAERGDVGADALLPQELQEGDVIRVLVEYFRPPVPPVEDVVHIPPTDARAVRGILPF